MNTEITDKNAQGPAGWIYFDGDCRSCTALRQRWGNIFERRGFLWIPLQTPGTAERLGIAETQLQAEMWVQLADGRKFSGINAWSVQMRRVWWLWPVGVVIAIPGFSAVGRAVYRWLARHRRCIGGACAVPRHTQAHG